MADKNMDSLPKWLQTCWGLAPNIARQAENELKTKDKIIEGLLETLELVAIDTKHALPYYGKNIEARVAEIRNLL